MEVLRLLLILTIATQVLATNHPHIVFILADDLGWNDVSFHGSNQIPTYNIDALGYNGVVLNRHYVQPTCTPSRASLMTGKYSVHTGIHMPLASTEKNGLNLTEKILPEYLRELGYSTHIVGKWHLGFHERAFTPLQRGFDSHYGYWSGAISYYDHIYQENSLVPPNTHKFSGHDMKRDYTPDYGVVGQYATDLFTKEAINVIKNHPEHKPLFLYLPHLAPHAGNDGKLLEAPQDVINRFSYISDPNRRTYAAMVSKLDESIGEVIDALDKKNMLNNSIIVFLSDNGARNEGMYNNFGSNLPFRGQKNTLWEGGLRTPAVVWSPLIKKRSRVSYDLMHISDWLPTLINQAGYPTRPQNIDGEDQWQAITQGAPNRRDYLLLEVDPTFDWTAIMLNDFKYVKGPTRPRDRMTGGNFLNTHSTVTPKHVPYDYQKLTESLAWRALQKYSTDVELVNRVPRLRREATVSCERSNSKLPECQDEACLFNLRIDPCEQNNVASQYPELFNHTQDMVRFYKKTGAPVTPLIRYQESNPELCNNTWCMWASNNVQ